MPVCPTQLTAAMGCRAVWLGLAGLALGYNFSLANWAGELHAESGVLQSLRPAQEPGFDFSPADVFDLRNSAGNYHTGDFTFHWRRQGSQQWQSADTAAARNSTPPRSSTDQAILTSDFAPVFADAASLLDIRRDWSEQDGDLVLTASFQAKGAAVELGSFGFAMEFNNIFTNRAPEYVTAECVLVDPYIGRDAGYVQVTRLSGLGPNLVVVPANNASRLEAYRFLEEDSSQPLGYQYVPFEGVYSFEMLTAAYAETAWKDSVPWNEPTSATLAPGESVSYSVRFTAASQLWEIEDAVASQGLPVAVGLPGYIVPSDMQASLHLKTNLGVRSITTDPANALEFTAAKQSPAGYVSFDVTNPSSSFGRVRASIVYSTGLVQTVHYWAATPANQTFARLGQFLTDRQWFNDSTDPFNRADSVISYDFSAGAQVLQDSRAWIAGISDEAGAGSFVAAAMTAAVLPAPDQVAQLEQMVNTSIWGHLQASSGDAPYSVRKSAWFYDPSAVPGYAYQPGVEGAWTKSEAYATDRAYDYVWVSALYYGLYRADRASPGVLTTQPRAWYLEQAFQTIKATFATLSDGSPRVNYADLGLMGETVWVDILADLHAENQTSQAAELESIMRARQRVWAGRADPFGSEMPWDSTGQEGVYLWSRYFNDTASAAKTLSSIRGYTPTVAHWGWNGNARRYWDFLYAGKTARVERMLHHYGSGLNAVPLLTHYRSAPAPGNASAFYDLRVGYGGHMGPLSSVNAAGFAACAFHSYPQTLAWDGYSGDYGPNALGHLRVAGTYLVEHPVFGWVAFGGNIVGSSTAPADADAAASGASVTVVPRDAVRQRIYVADAGLEVAIDAGQVAQFRVEQAAGGGGGGGGGGVNRVTVDLERAAGSAATSAVLVYRDTLAKGVRLATEGLGSELGGHRVPLPGRVTFAL